MEQIEFQQDVVRVITNLSAAINNMNLYSKEHPQAKRSVETAFVSLSDLLRAKKEITLLAVDENIIVDNFSLKANGPQLKQFTRILKDSAIERLTFVAGLPMPDFLKLTQSLAADDANPVRSNEFIKLGKIDLKVKKNLAATSQPPSEEDIEQLQELEELRDLKYDELKTIYHDIKQSKSPDLRSVEDMINAFISGFARGLNPLGLLASLKSSDEYTFTHVVNVCLLTVSQAEALGISDKQLYDVGIASVVHDVGKLFIPDEIINKPGALTPQEREIIESHAVLGAQYLLQMKNIPDLAVLGALEHHIRYDGGGYPKLADGWKPTVVSQMIAVADVFDALRSRRSYSEPKPTEVAVKIITEEKGTTFNPILVDNFLALISR